MNKKIIILSTIAVTLIALITFGIIYLKDNADKAKYINYEKAMVQEYNKIQEETQADRDIIINDLNQASLNGQQK